ncbi:transcriptional activator ToxR [Vibrio astriarenae]|nr:transcriptional activator ToxR [Vibrio sp. C7]
MSNLGNKFVLANKFLFDPNNNSLLEQSTEENIRLGSNESRILLLLAQRPNEVVTRTELHEYVWREQGFEVDDSSLTQAISTLRKLLKDPTKKS